MGVRVGLGTKLCELNFVAAQSSRLNEKESSTKGGFTHTMPFPCHAFPLRV
jgi:hypothetical protein